MIRSPRMPTFTKEGKPRASGDDPTEGATPATGGE